MTFKKIITTISLLSLCLPFSGLKKEEQNCLNSSDVKYAFHDNAELVYSYEDIIEASYQKAIERLNDNGVEMPYRSKKRKSVVYNSKMCFENDAKYWKN